MFEGAIAKLRDARTAIDRLQGLITTPKTSNIQIISGRAGRAGDPAGTSDPVVFAEAFSSCVMQIRAVQEAILNDGEADEQGGFDDWKDSTTDACAKDELISFINEKRRFDLHQGQSPLLFAMHPFSFNSDAVGGPPSPTASLFVDGMGAYWVVDRGTPRERRLPVESRGNVLYTVRLANPPTTHLGKALPSTDPVAVLRVVEGYYANLLFEARRRFGPED